MQKNDQIKYKSELSEIKRNRSKEQKNTLYALQSKEQCS